MVGSELARGIGSVSLMQQLPALPRLMYHSSMPTIQLKQEELSSGTGLRLLVWISAGLQSDMDPSKLLGRCGAFLAGSTVAAGNILPSLAMTLW